MEVAAVRGSPSPPLAGDRRHRPPFAEDRWRFPWPTEAHRLPQAHQRTLRSWSPAPEPAPRQRPTEPSPRQRPTGPSPRQRPTGPSPRPRPPEPAPRQQPQVSVLPERSQEPAPHERPQVPALHERPRVSALPERPQKFALLERLQEFAPPELPQVPSSSEHQPDQASTLSKEFFGGVVGVLP